MGETMMTPDQKMRWQERIVGWLWIIVVAAFSTFVTIKVTISEVQAQILSTKEIIYEMKKSDQVMLDRIHSLEIEDTSSKEQRMEIARRLDKIDKSQEKIMELLSRMAFQKGKQ
jgi:septal ring factor EnvC (AmiA/AmiB activator)